MTIPHSVEAKFKELFRERPLLLRSPGRVNLIGEHTDYNHGYVLPAAIDKAITFAISPRTDGRCALYAHDLREEHAFGIGELCSTPKGWPNYLMGVVDQLVRRGYEVGGFNCVFGGDIPIGAGLSSSAAIEAGLAFALNTIFELGIGNLDLVKIAQKAENEFVGVQCGIMDQYINIFGEQDHALCLDCRSLESQRYPIDHNVSIVLFDTHVSHSLASSEYNRRRMECNEGVDVIRKSYPHVTHLRDVTLEMLTEFKEKMSPVTYKRCRYVVEENERVLKACCALEEKDLDRFGHLMYETHEGLRRDYEVSCSELDYLVELVKGNRYVYGARMMGGGFGGCTINLVAHGEAERVRRIVIEKYKSMFEVEPTMYVTSISAGTGLLAFGEETRGIGAMK